MFPLFCVRLGPYPVASYEWYCGHIGSRLVTRHIQIMRIGVDGRQVISVFNQEADEIIPKVGKKRDVEDIYPIVRAGKYSSILVIGVTVIGF